MSNCYNGYMVNNNNNTVVQVGSLLRGECGILFTNEKTADVLEYFQNLAESDYAR